MATKFEMDCALMAGAAYVSNRPDKNAFPGRKKGTDLFIVF
jgi:hypothetical protein